MRYEILGPLCIIDRGRRTSVGSRKVQTLLSTLLARADQLVTREQLITEIWGEHPPRRASAGLHVYVSQLRKALADGDTDGTPAGPSGGPVVTRASGYVLDVSDSEIDAQQFTRLAEEGRQQLREHRPEAARATLRAALDLWRGPILDNLSPGPILDGYLTSLVETRLECQELLVESMLQLGRHRELIAPLQGLTAAHPLREAFYRQLMLALYRSERAGDALQVFQVARRVLRDELGLEPCWALQDLQRGILAADRVLDRVLDRVVLEVAA
ncbi:AfsR/SARP family transcriptional regulator [Dactylosporangium aurantiacum]|uniref:AfsR/SARP family transcriptional regulator n=1 Tax=Dactylosporangium aurantiacum TaxID=35754 RepID=A0A9Q9MIZ0_9ACTN|nr:AfsR/SARP family transcriptional regulator [Dactylosporangium aurantiacum]MDG6110108.1 AfsR/SARP family transcriptional regulator [Dactylosporangium aurantiacum]UWZ58434.1 AfsR/SARP family transcriptional regulator [Dactylosporangium aurantiacum]